MSVARNGAWIAATLVVAAAVHAASLLAVPHVIMNIAMTGIARGAGGVNRMAHGMRPTATSRGVVRPSPDLLYSSCVYDLGTGPLHVQAHGMPSTYWSISVFDADTNNFFVIDDRQAKGGAVDFTIVSTHQDPDPVGLVVRSPTRRGLVLVRTLIDDDAHLPAIDRARRHAACEALKR